MPEYVCRDLSVPDGGHGEIAASALFWVEAATKQAVTWRTPTSAQVYPTCPRCGRRVGEAVRNDSATV